MEDIKLTEREAKLLRDFNKMIPAVQDKVIYICARMAEEMPARDNVIYLHPRLGPLEPRTTR